jgi:hypothetical protein
MASPHARVHVCWGVGNDLSALQLLPSAAGVPPQSAAPQRCVALRRLLRRSRRLLSDTRTRCRAHAGAC